MKTFIILILMGASLSVVHAQLDGTWNVQDASVPSNLVINKDGSGNPTGVSGNLDFGLDPATVQLVTTGSFNTPGGPAQIYPLNNAQSEIVVSNGPSFTMSYNTNQDVACATFSDGNSYNHLVFLKAPDSFTTDQLAGNWEAITWDAPAQLIPQYTNGYLTAILGINDQPVDSFQPAYTQTLTCDTNGNFAVNGGATATGTFAAQAGGQITISVNDTTPFQFTGFVNKSLDFVTAANNNPPNETNQLEYIIMVKPGNPTTAEMAGLWHVSTLMTPSGITTNYDFDGSFKTESFDVVAGYDGSLIVRNPDGTSVASWVANGSGMTIQTGQGTMTAYVNQSKTAMIINEGNGLDVAVKAAEPTQGSRDMGLLMSGGTDAMWWAPLDSNTVLQTSMSLNGVWADVPGTQGVNHFTPTNTAAASFYRVKE